MGVPDWLLAPLRILDCVSIDELVFSPLLGIGVACIVTGATGNDWETSVRAVLITVGVVFTLLFGLMVLWARRFPSIPDADDVDKVPIIGGLDTYPKAPVMPLKGELFCKGSQYFKDLENRNVLLRGVNLGGVNKVPTIPNGATFNKEGFYDWQNVTFVNRPFPLDEADLHLSRLRAWGYCFLRFLVTWEAVEHAGPGIYDEEYLDYLVKMLGKCEEHGITVFLDFHQDVWSRWTGGDGAPAWTLLKVGFCLENLDGSAAAVTHQNFGDPFPKMVWNSNNFRLAAGTMWTLFFAGNDFAPQTRIDGQPVQEYLQGHFCDMLTHVAARVKDCKNVVGFDFLNEPNVGFVGTKDVRDISDNQFYVGWRVGVWDAIRLGAGFTRTVDYFSSFLRYSGRRTLNKDCVCAWTNGPKSCVWKENGVWELNEKTGKPTLLRPDHFARNPKTNSKVDFLNDYGIPFWLRCSKAIRKEMPDAIMFAEPIFDMTDPNAIEKPTLSEEDVGEAGFVWARHWYDGITLMSKTFSKYLGLETVSGAPTIGLANIESAHGKAVASFKEEAKLMGQGGCPVLIGETGIPFDMDSKRAFKSGNFDQTTLALNTTMRALEIGLVSFTLWNYTPDNNNERGDLWNDEDLSLFSTDQNHDPEDLHSGGRSLHAAVRPYPFRIAGVPVALRFDPYSPNRTFSFQYRNDPDINSRETVIFIPRYHYPNGADVVISDGTYEIDWDAQTLIVTHDPSAESHSVVIVKSKTSSGAAAVTPSIVVVSPADEDDFNLQSKTSFLKEEEQDDQ